MMLQYEAVEMGVMAEDGAGADEFSQVFVMRGVAEAQGAIRHADPHHVGFEERRADVFLGA